MQGQAIDYAINKIANGDITYELAEKMLKVLNPRYTVSKFLRKIVGKETECRALYYNVSSEFVDRGLLDEPSDGNNKEHFKELAGELRKKQEKKPASSLQGLLNQVACL